MGIGTGTYTTYGIWVELKPTELAVANETYLVDLYEDGQPRATAVVTWNELELDVLKTKIVAFPATKPEFDAYHGHDISHIFQVSVESSPIALPSSSLVTCQVSSVNVTAHAIKISGTIINKSPWSIGNVRIEVKLLDDNDKVLRREYIAVSPSVIYPTQYGAFSRVQQFQIYFETFRYYPVWEWIPPQPSS
jgi:hypothetical protein